jgi:hypothetical protein
MPQQVSWLIEDIVILGRVWGKNALEGLQEYNNNVNKFLDASGAEKVYLVYDGREAEGMPPLRAFQNFTFPKHPRFKGVIVLRTMNPFLNFIASATTQIAGVRAHFANTPDEVFALLHDLMPDLPDTTAYRPLLEKETDSTQDV